MHSSSPAPALRALCAVGLLATAAIVATTALALALPPSDPTAQPRYISDGLADHRPLAWAAMAAGVLAVGTLCALSHVTAHRLVQSKRITCSHRLALLAGALSILGLSLVAAFPAGHEHNAGAAVFYLFYVAHHCSLFTVLNAACPMDLHATFCCLLALAAASAIPFVALLLLAPSLPAANLAAIAFQYMVTLVSLLLHVHALSMAALTAHHHALQQGPVPHP